MTSELQSRSICQDQREGWQDSTHPSLSWLQMTEPGLKVIGSFWEGLSCPLPTASLEREERLWVAEVCAWVGPGRWGGRPSPGIGGEATERVGVSLILSLAQARKYGKIW